MKTCTKCAKTLKLTDFPTNTGTKDGRGSQCRECCKAYNRAHKERNAPPSVTLTHKPCTTCGIDQPIENYSKQIRTRDGHRPNCKVCEKAVNKERYARKKLNPTV